MVRGDDLPGDVETIAIRPVWQLSDVEERRTKYAEVDFTGRGETPVGGVASDRTGKSPPARLRRPPVTTRTASAFGCQRLTRFSTGPRRCRCWDWSRSHRPGSESTRFSRGMERRWWRRPYSASGGPGPVGLAGAVDDPDAHGERVAGGTRALVDADRALWRDPSGTRAHRRRPHRRDRPLAAGETSSPFGEHDVIVSEPSDQQALKPDRGLVGLGLPVGWCPAGMPSSWSCWPRQPGRLGLGIVLVLAFGFGMALVLVAVGVLAGRLRRRVVRGPDREAYGAWERRLGIASGLTLAVIGVYLLGLA